LIPSPLSSDEKNPFGCPSCHSYAIYRSKLHGIRERLKKHFTIERPYRCHECGWRGWLENIRYATYPLPGGQQTRRHT
jgi:predicted RNA-binding Zn-ribbon protein involved in translation (DUF1610 family)